MRASAILALAALPFFDRHCSHGAAETPAASSSVASAKSKAAPLRVEPLDSTTKPPMYVLRGGERGPEKIVFLHGMCGHGLGYAQSFQQSAARRGLLIAPQADVLCGDGPWARWSKDLDALDARIVAAFRALGATEPIADVIVIGYSQGATRAESLARKFPERYTRLVLMGGPYAAKSEGLETLRAAVAMAGDHDRLDLMRASAKVLNAARVPATFMLIPDATHGSMGSEPEKTMDEVFAWLIEHQRPNAR